jgi:hypothetical protein
MSGGAPNVIVQRITTIWTKRTRGAPGREHRARLPVAYPLPESLLGSAPVCACHGVVRAEATGYGARSVAFDVTPQRDLFLSARAAFVIDARVDLW